MTALRPRILCVHQGGELYGSDRSFLQAVEAIRKGWPKAHIRVLLAVDGPLAPLLRQVADEVAIRDMWILRLADPLSTGLKGTIGLPYYVGRAAREIAAADLAYINTTVIADYMIAARRFAARSVIHVREIPKSRVMPVIRGLVKFSRAQCIFNSAATETAFALPVSQKQAVIHNSANDVADAAPLDLPERFSRERPLRIAMLGRINDWKGQDLLIEALARLTPEQAQHVSARIVGSTFRDVTAPVEALHAQIAAAGLSEHVTIEPFKDDPSEVYRWADICAVPSRLPEPFGRVAIEAMAEYRPVIAAAHGGLVEIVQGGVNGWLFPPNDASALADAIGQALAAPTIVALRGAEAGADFSARFSASAKAQQLQVTLAQWLPALA